MEYCDSLFFEACDIGRGSVDLRFGFGGDVIRGWSGGWLGFAPGEVIAGGDVAGDDDGDMTAVIFRALWTETRASGRLDPNKLWFMLGKGDRTLL